LQREGGRGGKVVPLSEHIHNRGLRAGRSLTWPMRKVLYPMMLWLTRLEQNKANTNQLIYERNDTDYYDTLYNYTAYKDLLK